MKSNLKKNLIIFVLALVLYSCGGASNKKSEQALTETKDVKSSAREESPEQTSGKKKNVAASKSEEGMIASEKDELRKQDETELNTNQNLEQTGRKFIRTAEMRFKTTSVSQSTYAIEDLTAKYNGFITLSELKSTIINKTQTEISSDSILVSNFYQTQNNLTIRIPNQKLDSFLRDLNKLVEFLDFRIIRASDVSLMLLANQLRTNRLNNYNEQQTQAIQKQSQDLQQNTNAQNNLLDKQNQLDDSKIQELKTNDDIEYSTVNMAIYQNDKVHQEMIENYQKIKNTQDNFWKSIGKEFMNGIWLFQQFILLIVKLWPLVLVFVAFAAFLIYISRKNKK